MPTVGRDIVFALRMLARNPGFAFVTAATLALGIGANTAIFSVVEGVLLKPLPFRAPAQLTMVWQRSPSAPQLGISELDLDDYRERTRVYAGLGGFTVPGARSAILTGAGNPVEIAPSYITQNYFSVLGVAPLIGRDFLPEEGRRGPNHVAILSYALWQSRFAGSPEILRQQITLDKRQLQIIGVMGPDVYPAGADVFVPFALVNPDQPMPRNYHELNVVGRLRPGQTVADAQREMASLSAELAHAYPLTNSSIGASISPLREEITGKVREPILMLLSAVGLVLLIACANVANLLSVRASARRKEIAIRVALGAGRRHIVTQFLMECLLLSSTGALLGLLMAFAGMPVIRTLGAQRIPRLQSVVIDSEVLLFTVALAALTGLLFGILPALRYSAANLNQVLRSGGRTSLSDSGRLRNVLVAGEVALSLVVLVCASLLVRSLNQLLDVYPGFASDHLLAAHLSLPANHYGQAAVDSFYTRLLPKIAGLPGVVSVSTTTALPLQSGITQMRFAVKDTPLADPGKYPVTAIASVDTGYFKTMGIPILRGRPFHRDEVGNLDAETCIVSSALVRNFFGGRDPVGRILFTNLAAASPEPCQIVGVAGDTRAAGLDVPAPPLLYFASYAARDTLLVRTSVDPMAVAPAVQHEVAAADPEQPLSGIQPMAQVISQSLSRRSFAAVLLGMFSILGLVLAALGLYGVVSYSVSQRTREIGVRIALGARPSSVFRLILLQGLGVTLSGLAIGVVAAAGAARLISNLLFGVGAADPLSYVAGCVLLTAISGLACFVPARRAMRVDPVVSLRYE